MSNLKLFNMESNIFKQVELGTGNINFFANVDGQIQPMNQTEWEQAGKIIASFPDAKYIKYVRENTFEIGFNK